VSNAPEILPLGQATWAASLIMRQLPGGWPGMAG